MASFDLIEQSWIPCIVRGSEEPRLLGLREVLVAAPGIQAISDPSPLITVALHRLLLAILHRNFGPQTESDWAEMWVRGSWDLDALDGYLDRWHDRFDLFDERHPFYQVASLEPEYAVQVSKLATELSSGNNATLFDHTTAFSDLRFSPDTAARYLLACQSFSVGGLVSYRSRHGESANPYKYADASPLTKSALTLVRGNNLFETLMLNLIRYSPEDELPFPSEADDAPAWELDAETQAAERHPRGYLDLLTWQSRRVRLIPEMDERGCTVVRRVVLMKGYQFPEAGERYGRETMLAFVRNTRPGEDPWPAIGFQEGRAVWRDSLALFQSVSGERQRPKVLDWLNDLAFDGHVERSQTLPLDLYGMTTDRANVLLWRHERLPLPLEYLSNDKLLDKLRVALDVAEETSTLFRTGYDSVRTEDGARTVPRPIQVLARSLLTTSEEREPDREALRQLCEHLAPERLYWSRLDTEFRRFLVDLAQDVDEEGEYGTRLVPAWMRTVRTAAWETFREVTNDLGTSARALRAVAQAERTFNRGLSRTVPLVEQAEGTSKEELHEFTRQ